MVKGAGVKDKAKPKGPMSAYACFVQVIREEHRRKHPEESIDFSEFSKKCGEKWKTMSAKERMRFEDMASVDKNRYQKEMTNFIANGGGGPGATVGKRGMKRKRVKDPNMPKRAWSAFFFFCDEFRPHIRKDNPDWKVGDVAKELGRRWENCTDKTKYEAQAAADRQRYENEITQFKAGTFVKKAKVDHNCAPVAGDESEEGDDDEEDDE